MYKQFCRILSLFLITVLCLCVISCGENSQKNFYIKEEKTESKEEKYLCINVGEKSLELTLPEDVSNLQIKNNGSFVSFTRSNEWISVDYCYEIDKTISSPADCENKIKSITDALPPNSNNEDYSKVWFFNLNPSKWDAEHYYDNIWFDRAGTNGVSYFYESSTRASDESLSFEKLIGESYNSLGDGLCIHEKIEVTRFDFNAYYNSLETRVEQNAAESEFNRFNVTLRHKYDFSVTMVSETGFSGCLQKEHIME